MSLLAYNLLVILWGAMVRATGSGAGCGDHWPLCDGKVLPGLSDMHRIIEYSHRISVGFDLLLVGLFFIWAAWPLIFAKWERLAGDNVSRRWSMARNLGTVVMRPRHLIRLLMGHPVVFGALLTVVFTLSESLVGAGLVLFKLVAHDASLYRAVVVSIHLVNTFLLVASLALTVWWSTGRPMIVIVGQGMALRILMIAVFGTMATAITGAITALGDTLFPAGSISELGRLVPATAHFLIKLRIYHPMIAVIMGLTNIFIAFHIARIRPSDEIKQIAFSIFAFVMLQITLGFLNVFMLAPLFMQLLHLLVADALWIALILLAASALSSREIRSDQVRFGSAAIR